MHGYLIANYTIHDQQNYQEYVQAVFPILAKYEGKIVVGDLNPQNLEGNPRQFIIVIEFESVEAAQRFYTAPEYTELMPLRTSSTEGWVMIAKEFVKTET